MPRLFGTDGVRGVANVDLTPDLALRLARSAAAVLAPGGGRAVALVGRDPRPSGPMLEAAVCAGLAAAGVDVRRLGVVPTAAVAHLVRATGATLGVMITASHNPMPDNGIKFFDADGYKPADAAEDEIEARLEQSPAPVAGADVGRVTDAPELVPIREVLDRLPPEALARVPGAVVAGVLALAADDGPEAAA